MSGDWLVRLVYADEAGISNPKQEPFLVVASVIVHADQKLTAIERHLDSLVNRHIPEESRANFVFHAKEIFLGGKTIKRDDPQWPDEKRFAIADDLAAIPKKFDLPVTFGWLERKNFPVTFEYPDDMSAHDRAIAEHTSAFMSSAMVVEHWMRQHASNEVCVIIAEDNERSRKFIRDTQRFHQDDSYSWTIDPELRKHFPFRKIKQDPLFEPKRKSSPLQIADFCAYAFKRHLMQDHRYDRYVESFWKQVVYFESADFSKRPQLSGKHAQTPLRSRPRRSRGPT